MAGYARIIDSSSGCGSKLLCTHPEGQLGWCFDMPPHRMLLTTRAHPSLGWIPEFLHSEPWNIKHSWHYPSVSLSHLVAGAPLRLATLSLPVLNCCCSAKLEQKLLFFNVLWWWFQMFNQNSGLWLLLILVFSGEWIPII